jgi:magnesium transporter
MIITLQPTDIAYIMETMPDDTMPIMFRLLPKELAAEVFVELESDSQENLITGFSRAELKEVLDELYLDDTVDIVEEMPANVVKRILTASDPEVRKSINEVLQYPEDSTGSIMTTEFIDMKRNMTVEDALKRIQMLKRLFYQALIIMVFVAI